MKRFIAVATTLMAMAAVLPGCAIITKPDQRAAGIANGTAWQAHRAELADLTTWSLQGRVATGQLLVTRTVASPKLYSLRNRRHSGLPHAHALSLAATITRGPTPWSSSAR